MQTISDCWKIACAPLTGSTRTAKFVGDYYDDTGTNGLWSQPNMAEITWKIETSLTNDNYVTIKNNGGTSSIGYLSTPSNTTEGASLITSSVVNNNSTWELCLYTGDPIDGAQYTSSTSTMLKGETFTYSAYMYSSAVGRNGPVSYSSGDENVLTVHPTSGFVTAVAPGKANIWVTFLGAPVAWGRTIMSPGFKTQN